MVEKRKESHQMAENSKAQKAAPERRRGRFYLMLASWWPTTKGRRRWARKGVKRRLEALEESQNCAANVHSFPQGKHTQNAQQPARQRTETHGCDSRRKKKEIRLGHPLGIAAAILPRQHNGY